MWRNARGGSDRAGDGFDHGLEGHFAALGVSHGSARGGGNAD